MDAESGAEAEQSTLRTSHASALLPSVIGPTRLGNHGSPELSNNGGYLGKRRWRWPAPKISPIPVSVLPARGRVAPTRDPTRVRTRPISGSTRTRDRAAVLLGYALALRASELAGLDVADLTPDPHGLRVRIRRAKADQDGVGATLALVRGRRAATDPVRAVHAWVEQAGHTTGPLLRAVDRGGNLGHGRLNTSSVSRLLRRAGGHAGLDLTDLSPHSLRRGHITTAAQAGAPERQIARTSRHASLIVLRSYIDDAEVFNDPSRSYLGL